MKTVILLRNNGMGQAGGDLPQKLIPKYLSLLLDQTPLPSAICFYTDGVKLAVSGSPALPQLQALEAKGVRLILCKTCLDYFGKTEEVAAGEIAGMPDIIDTQFSADRVITL